MRCYPDDDDRDNLAKLNAEPWMVELLRLNPEYPHWGPYEDYMMRPGRDEPKETNPFGKDSGWESRALFDTWAEFGPWNLDCWNECVHFYFEVSRPCAKCETCEGSGYHPDARWVTESFYSHSSPFRAEAAQTRQIETLLRSFGNEAPSPKPLRRASSPSRKVLDRYGDAFSAFCAEMRVHGAWHDRITQDEVDALWEDKRLHAFGQQWHPETQSYSIPRLPTAEEVNAAQHGRGMDSHDGINRRILIRQRLKRPGLPKDCPACEGDGSVYTEPAAHVGLVLWMLHPRKGCSRGVHVRRLEQKELPAVLAWLKQAADSNAERFAAVVSAAVSAVTNAAPPAVPAQEGGKG